MTKLTPESTVAALGVDRIDDIAEEIYSVVEDSVTDMLALKPPATIGAECDRAAKAVLDAIAATCDALAALTDPAVLLGAWERLGKVWWDESEEAWRVTPPPHRDLSGRVAVSLDLEDRYAEGTDEPDCLGPEGTCGRRGPGHVPPCPLAIAKHLRDEHGTGAVDGLTDRRQAALHRQLHDLGGSSHPGHEQPEQGGEEQ